MLPPAAKFYENWYKRPMGKLPHIAVLAKISILFSFVIIHSFSSINPTQLISSVSVFPKVLFEKAVSSLPEVFCRKGFLKLSPNSQKNICAGVFFK